MDTIQLTQIYNYIQQFAIDAYVWIFYDINWATWAYNALIFIALMVYMVVMNLMELWD